MLRSIVHLTVMDITTINGSSSLKFQRRNERKMKCKILHFNECCADLHRVVASIKDKCGKNLFSKIVIG